MKTILLCIFLFSLAGELAAQVTPPVVLTPETSCYFLPGPDVKDLYEFDPSPSVLEQVAKIANNLGIDPLRFDVKAANVPNANAIIMKARRKVLYSTGFFNDLANSPGGKWAVTAVLAHEIAHHLNGDPLDIGPDRAGAELKADWASGKTVCELGGSWREAQSALVSFGGQQHPSYPPLSARLEAVAQGWQKAKDLGHCPEDGTHEITGVPITQAQNIIVVNAGNVDQLKTHQSLTGAAIRFENVQLRATQPLVLLANKITFDETSTLSGRDLKLIAVEIEGGQVSTAAGQGEDGGKLLIAAERITGTNLTARGGDGQPGISRPDGKNGRPGQNGTNGECGPGMLHQFVGSTAGEPGENGTDGQDGGPGGNGGNGGQILLLRFQQHSLALDVNPGEGGHGGAGGRGGHGGTGGRGGAGCQGLGGSQPTRPDGPDGSPGRDGRSGPQGPRGRSGRVWNTPIAGSSVIRDILKKTGDINETARQLESLALAKGES